MSASSAICCSTGCGCVRRLQAVERLPGHDVSAGLLSRGSPPKAVSLRRGKRHRVLATVCDIFPIYSQTFVYQELTQLARQGFDVRLVYSKLASRDYLSPQFGHLWKVKRRLFLNRSVHEKDFARYQCPHAGESREPGGKLCESSGLSRHDLFSHGNFLAGFFFYAHGGGLSAAISSLVFFL